LDVLFNGTEGSFFVADFVEMKNAVARATEDDIVDRPLFRRLMETMNHDIVTQLQKVVLDPKPVFSQQLLVEAIQEIEHLRTLVRELQSETHRLEKLVNYGQ
jgi:hypothetical protein